MLRQPVTSTTTNDVHSNSTYVAKSEIPRFMLLPVLVLLLRCFLSTRMHQGMLMMTMMMMMIHDP